MPAAAAAYPYRQKVSLLHVQPQPPAAPRGLPKAPTPLRPHLAVTAPSPGQSVAMRSGGCGASGQRAAAAQPVHRKESTGETIPAGAEGTREARRFKAARHSAKGSHYALPLGVWPLSLRSFEVREPFLYPFNPPRAESSLGAARCGHRIPARGGRRQSRACPCKATAGVSCRRGGPSCPHSAPPRSAAPPAGGGRRGGCLMGGAEFGCSRVPAS